MMEAEEKGSREGKKKKKRNGNEEEKPVILIPFKTLLTRGIRGCFYFSSLSTKPKVF